MTKRRAQKPALRRQAGFTLVEIGVVLVIIGLLLGAVLKGQELIGSARVFNLAQSINGYRAAINGFQDRYRMLPGESATASTKVGNGAVNCTSCCDDGFISCWNNISLVNNHLASSGFYSGPQLTVETNAFPGANGYLNNPGNAPIFVAFWDQFSNPGGAFGGAPSSHIISTGWNLSSRLLAELDRKIDDGNAWTGQLRFGWGGDSTRCFNTSTGAWIESNPWPYCAASTFF